MQKQGGISRLAAMDVVRNAAGLYGGNKGSYTQLQMQHAGGGGVGGCNQELNASSSDEHVVELHGPEHARAPGSFETAPSVQTMVEGAVRLVSMLNFMKVELGDHKTLRSKEQWRAAGAEFIGTMLFVYLGCGSVVASGMLVPGMTAARLIAIAMAHGLAIAFLAGATGAISGGHLNPAVTLAFVIAGKENLLRAGLYVSAQFFFLPAPWSNHWSCLIERLNTKLLDRRIGIT
eukprot:c44202_g1_i1 orf=188-886(+)